MAQQNPFQPNTAGSNAFKAAYDRLKAESEARKQGIAGDYASAYQQLRGQTYAQGMGGAARAGLSGGQGAVAGQRVNAAQMGQLTNLMQGQEKALREQKLGESSIYSNAMLEGQQAQQYEQQQQQAELQRQQQISAIMSDTKLSETEKRSQIQTLGGNYDQVTRAIQEAERQGMSPFDIGWSNFWARWGSRIGSSFNQQNVPIQNRQGLGGFIGNVLLGGFMPENTTEGGRYYERDANNTVREYTYRNGQKVYL